LQNTQKIAFLLAQNPMIQSALAMDYQNGKNIDTSRQSQLLTEDKIRTYLTSIQSMYGFSNIFIFSENGKPIFALNTNLQAGTDKNDEPAGELAKTFNRAKTLLEPQLSYLTYIDQYSKPQLYIATPIINKGVVLGVLVLQMSNSFIEKTILNVSGLGSTGETLVGSIKDGRIELAVDLRHMTIDDFQAATMDMQGPMLAAFEGATSGIKMSGVMKDYRNKDVLAVTRYVPSMGWGLLVKLDSNEAFAPVFTLWRNAVLLGLLTVLGTSIIAYYISDRLQKAQNKMKHLLNELEVANHAVEDANKAKSMFLSNMSHELRTPLNAVIGYSEMLAEEFQERGSEEYLPDLNRINTAGKHLLSLINNVLDISKIEAGKMELTLEHVEVERVLSDIATIVQPLATKKHNNFILNYPPAMGEMYTDPTKLRQSLINLIGNACKFTENGTVSLDVECFETNFKPWIKFTVNDTGIGISEENLNRLFKAFSQVATPHAQGGTGLGLYLSMQFCRLLGGNISVESKVNQGSSFTIILPRIYEPPSAIIELPKTPIEVNKPIETLEKPTQDLKPLEAIATGILSKESTRKVLVIDDDINVHMALENMLINSGLILIQAYTGESGLFLVKEHHPDLILLDISLPGIDGWQVLSHLKADEHLRDIPVIMLTQLTSEKFAFSRGVADYLVKPVGSNMLIDHIKKNLTLKELNYILVVDDDEAMRNLAVQPLRKVGWRVEEAANGKIAMQKIQEEIPSLILLDLMMPEMNGFEVIECLQENEVWSKIPVVVLTAAMLSNEELDRLKQASLRVFQKSSYRKSDLLEEIREVMK
jgi:signal transduction histidine kinase/DNA-binding response OmpR family regulator